MLVPLCIIHSTNEIINPTAMRLITLSQIFPMPSTLPKKCPSQKSIPPAAIEMMTPNKTPAQIFFLSHILPVFSTNLKRTITIRNASSHSRKATIIPGRYMDSVCIKKYISCKKKYMIFFVKASS
jgi:hypothetical protein